MKPSLEHLQWVVNLKQGDKVDCVKSDSGYRKQCWAPGYVETAIESHLKIQFLYDREIASR